MSMDYLTMKQAMGLVIFLYYVLAGYIILTKVFKRSGGGANISIATIAVVVLLLSFALSNKIREDEAEAVIISPTPVDVRFEAIKDAMVHYPLYSGMTAYVIKERNGWYKIARPDGKVGWDPVGVLEIVKI